MNKKQLTLLLSLTLLSATITGCFNNKPDPDVIDLETRLERIEAEKEAAELQAAQEEQARLKAEQKAKEEELENAAAADKAKLEKELADLKAKLNKAPVVTPAPASSVNNYGPGDFNNINTPSEGWVSVCTKSANGKLTLRSGASTSSAQVAKIANGEYNIYYFNKVKVGDYVWYNVDYNGFVGWLRGDYLCI